MFSHNIENDNEFDWNKKFISKLNGDQMKFQSRISKEKKIEEPIKSESSNVQQPKNNQFDLDCDLQLDDLDDNKISTQHYTSEI